MSNTTKLLNVDLGLFILRLSTGILMLFHGVSKFIHGHGHIKGILEETDLPQFLWVGVPLTEVVAPVLLILGIFTRLAGLGIALVMVSAIFLAFGWHTFSIGEYGGLVGELNLLFLFAGITIFFTGGGKYVLYKPQNAWLK